MAMKGVHFITDESGNRKSVVLDLDEWGEVWEDFYDGMLADATKRDKDVPWEHAVKAMLDARMDVDAANAALSIPVASSTKGETAIDMKSVRFITDERGNRKSVVLDLDEWGEVWEDFYDGMLAKVALQERPYAPWEQVKADMQAEIDAETDTEIDARSAADE